MILLLETICGIELQRGQIYFDLGFDQEYSCTAWHSKNFPSSFSLLLEYWNSFFRAFFVSCISPPILSFPCLWLPEWLAIKCYLPFCLIGTWKHKALCMSPCCLYYTSFLRQTDCSVSDSLFPGGIVSESEQKQKTLHRGFLVGAFSQVPWYMG